MPTTAIHETKERAASRIKPESMNTTRDLLRLLAARLRRQIFSG